LVAHSIRRNFTSDYAAAVVGTLDERRVIAAEAG
jgi:hypothetical protein